MGACVEVNSDKLMMRMFNLNMNPTDVILLEVKRVKLGSLEVLPTISHTKVEEETIEINDEVQNASGGDNGGKDDIGVDDEGEDLVGNHVGVDKKELQGSEYDEDENIIGEEYIESADNEVDDEGDDTAGDHVGVNEEELEDGEYDEDENVGVKRI